MNKPKAQWLDGYYPPVMDEGFEEWQKLWSMGPHADQDWVWFKGGYYTEEQAREILRTKPLGTKADE